MFDDDLPRPKIEDFPRNLVNMSVDDLRDYVFALEQEIERVNADMKKKKASSAAAEAFFK